MQSPAGASKRALIARALDRKVPRGHNPRPAETPPRARPIPNPDRLQDHRDVRTTARRYEARSLTPSSPWASVSARAGPANAARRTCPVADQAADPCGRSDDGADFACDSLNPPSFISQWPEGDALAAGVQVHPNFVSTAANDTRIGGSTSISRPRAPRPSCAGKGSGRQCLRAGHNSSATAPPAPRMARSSAASACASGNCAPSLSSSPAPPSA